MFNCHVLQPCQCSPTPPAPWPAQRPPMQPMLPMQPMPPPKQRLPMRAGSWKARCPATWPRTLRSCGRCTRLTRGPQSSWAWRESVPGAGIARDTEMHLLAHHIGTAAWPLWVLHRLRTSHLRAASPPAPPRRWHQSYIRSYQFSGINHLALPLPPALAPMLAWANGKLPELMKQGGAQGLTEFNQVRAGGAPCRQSPRATRPHAQTRASATRAYLHTPRLHTPHTLHPPSPTPQVLLNWYQDGTHHMGAHSDAERELIPLAPIISVSLGQERIFRVRRKWVAQGGGCWQGQGGGGLVARYACARALDPVRHAPLCARAPSACVHAHSTCCAQGREPGDCARPGHAQPLVPCEYLAPRSAAMQHHCVPGLARALTHNRHRHWPRHVR